MTKYIIVLISRVKYYNLSVLIFRSYGASGNAGVQLATKISSLQDFEK